jgi:DNA transposition AAA+ family ATPase
MKDKIVPVKNLQRLAEHGEMLRTRNPRTPGIGVVSGETGFGKSTGLTWYGVRKVRAIYVRAMELWTPSAMLEAIGDELGITIGRNLAKAAQQVVGALVQQNRMLIVDEADYVVEKRRLINTLRDIHDLAGTPLILVGMKEFQKKLRTALEQRQFANRVAFQLEFLPTDFDDTRLTAAELLEIDIDDELLRRVHDASDGNMRDIVVGLQRIETHFRAKGAKKATAKEWGNRPLNLRDSGNGPAPRPTAPETRPTA